MIAKGRVQDICAGALLLTLAVFLIAKGKTNEIFGTGILLLMVSVAVLALSVPNFLRWLQIAVGVVGIACALGLPVAFYYRHQTWLGGCALGILACAIAWLFLFFVRLFRDSGSRRDSDLSAEVRKAREALKLKMLIGLAAVVFIAITSFGISVFVVLISESFQVAEVEIQNSAIAKDVLGDNIKVEKPATFSVLSTECNMSLKVRGSKTQGQVTVEEVKVHGHWQVITLVLHSEDGKISDLLDEEEDDN